MLLKLFFTFVTEPLLLVWPQNRVILTLSALDNASQCSLELWTCYGMPEVSLSLSLLLWLAPCLSTVGGPSCRVLQLRLTSWGDILKATLGGYPQLQTSCLPQT